MSVKSFLWLIGITAACWMAVALGCALLGGAEPKVTLLAALVCLVPGLMSIRLADKARMMSPIMHTAVLLGSGMVRIIVATGLGGLIYFLDPSLKGSELALLLWGTFFYLVTLVVETVLVYRHQMAQ